MNTALPTAPAAATSTAGPLAKLIAMSKASPDSDLAKQTMTYIKQGKYDEQAQKEGIDLSWAGRPKTPSQTTVPAPSGELPTLATNTKNAALAGGADMTADVEGMADTLQKPVATTPSLTDEIQRGASLAGGGIDTGLAGTGTLFAPVAGLVKTLSDNASDNPHVQKFAQAIAPLLDAANTGVGSMQDLASKHPDIAKNVGRVLGLATAEGGEELGGVAKDTAADAIKNIADNASAATKKVGDAAKKANDAVTTIPSPVPSLSKVAEGPGMIAKGARRIQDAAQAKAALEALPAEVKNAVKTDLPQPVAEFVHGASAATKKAFSKMLDLQEKGVSTIGGAAGRAEDVIGQRILEAVKHVASANKKAAEDEGETVSNGLSGSPVDYGRTTQQFKDSLSSLNVNVGKDDRLDFSNSEFKGPSTSKDRGLLQSVWDEIKPQDDGTTVKDGKDVHTGRQALFNELSGRPKDDPFSGKTTTIAENARKGLLSDIADQAHAGSSYKNTATTFAKTQKALGDFYSLLGKKWAGKPEDILSLKAGEVSNRLKGNASADTNEVLGRIEDLAKQHGYTSDVNPKDLVEFNQVLKKIVGDTQSASLAGNISRGVEDALPHGAEVALHGLSGNLVGAGKAAIKFAKGNSRAEQIRALRTLLGTP